MDQREKAERFRKLHEGPGAFVIANAWDAGSARILEGLGFVALATSSGASAAREVKDKGSFGYLERCLSSAELNAFMEG